MIQITQGELMPHLWPPSAPRPDSNVDPNPDANVEAELSLADLLTYCAADVHTAHKVYSTSSRPSYPGRTPSPSQACLP